MLDLHCNRIEGFVADELTLRSRYHNSPRTIQRVIIVVLKRSSVTASGRCAQIANVTRHNVVSRTGRRESTRPSYCMSDFPCELFQAFLSSGCRERKRCSSLRYLLIFFSIRRLILCVLRLENVGGLEERLSGLEKTLVSMSHTITEIHKHLFLASLTTRPMAEPMDPNTSLDLGREYPFQGGFLARPDSDLTKLNKPRYVACDLPGLCDELRGSNMLVSGSISGISQTLLLKESVTKLLDELYRVGSTENPICIEPHDSPIHLPPRELLAMACASFFQSEDTPLDIFQHSVFWTNVERIYSSTFSDLDTAWAVSFCLIILLGLCSQQGENGLSTDFSKPYRSTVIRSLGSTTLFFTPKLINLQTLALLVSSLSKTFKYFNLS